VADAAEKEMPGRIGAADVARRSLSNPAGLAGRRIVVVEDDVMVARAIHLSLASLGASVIRYVSAEEALADSAIVDMDFYVSGFRLPGLNGVEFLDAIQKRSTKLVKAVLLTGDSSSDRFGTTQSSPWPVLFKPVDLLSLLSAIEAQDQRR
jgi:CheY-like chemotaxis protein